jgi:preprotein translocase subunit SecA
VTSTPSNFAATLGLASADSSRRLWPALASPREREQPTKGADILGEFALGWLKRTRARRLQWPRARAIHSRGIRVADMSEAEFSTLLAAARDLAILHRRDHRTVDEVFALAMAAIRREISLTLHVEQVLGALSMAGGCCAELATGEGKTLTAILPAALEAFAGRGVHVITVNDYLARRDAEITSPAYGRLRLSVGVVQEGSTPDERRTAYDASITYLADKQALFDHLRDRLVSPIWPRMTGLILDDLLRGQTPHTTPRDAPVDQHRLAISMEYRSDWGARVVQRGLHAAIIDEADSVLIDDAITPAVISGSDAIEGEDTSHYAAAAGIARALEAGADYVVEHRVRRAALTDAGRAKVAGCAHQLPAFWAGPRRREELLVRALTALAIYKRGEDYIIRDDKVEIIDRSTGRVLPGRQWQLGVHQAVEAKENVAVSKERHTTARCSYQDFFQRYNHLCGMTGTAAEVSAELWRWYRLPVVRIPTHKPVIRTMAHDRVFVTVAQKLEAVAARVQELHAEMRPILIGTRSITASEQLATVLRGRGVACDVLNADREPEEAAIVARAGRAGAVTVATNMAGRGTDIQLEETSRRTGGLAVIATERNDESRVDRQLFGRAGRQGDPGSAESFVSLDDAVVLQHGLRSLAALVRALGANGRTGALLRPISWLLWNGAQWAASRKWKTLRAETAKIEAWQDMALHQRSR